jgi:hypothetical protein
VDCAYVLSIDSMNITNIRLTLSARCGRQLFSSLSAIRFIADISAGRREAFVEYVTR